MTAVVPVDATMGKQSAAKKARVDAIYSQGMQDVLRLDAATTGGGNGGSSSSSSSSRARGVAIEQVDINWFRCPVCSRLLNRPVFQCKSGNLACGRCRAGQCRKCEQDDGVGGGGGSFDARNAVVEDIISVSKFKCPHSGCHGFFAYPDLRAHRGACHHAPCFCAEPGCAFAAPPPRLLRHLAVDHSWPAHGVAYGRVLRLRAPVPARQLLLADEDGRVFVLLVGALGAVTAASLVCVRAAGGGPSSQPRYTAALRAGGASMVAMDTMTSTDWPGEAAVDKLPCVLTVPPTCLLAGADGASNSKEVSLKIRIEKILPD